MSWNLETQSMHTSATISFSNEWMQVDSQINQWINQSNGTETCKAWENAATPQSTSFIMYRREDVVVRCCGFLSNFPLPIYRCTRPGGRVTRAIVAHRGKLYFMWIIKTISLDLIKARNVRNAVSRADSRFIRPCSTEFIRMFGSMKHEFRITPVQLCSLSRPMKLFIEHFITTHLAAYRIHTSNGTNDGDLGEDRSPKSSNDIVIYYMPFYVRLPSSLRTDAYRLP